MIAHREEIAARPARTWFQTPKEKLAVQQAAKEQNPTSRVPKDLLGAGGEEEAGKGGKRGKAAYLASKGLSDDAEKPKVKRDKYAGMTRKRRRALQRNEALAKEEEEGGLSLPNQKSLARGAKAAAKTSKLRQQGGSLREGEVGHDGAADDDGRPQKRARTGDASETGRGGSAPDRAREPPKGPSKKAPRVKPAAIKKKAAHSKPRYANRTAGRKKKR